MLRRSIVVSFLLLSDYWPLARSLASFEAPDSALLVLDRGGG
jgi:hypothetical protein